MLLDSQASKLVNTNSLTFLLSSASLHRNVAGAALTGDIVMFGGLFTAGFMIMSNLTGECDPAMKEGFVDK